MGGNPTGAADRVWHPWPAYLALTAAFGPYVVPSVGVMLGQAVLYPLSVWAFLSLCRPTHWRQVRDLLAVPSILVLMVLWALAATLGRHTGVSYMALLSQFENYLQPLAAVLVGLAVVGRAPGDCAPETGQWLGSLCWVPAGR